MTAAQHKVHEHLTLIKENVSVPQNTAKPSLFYADAARNSPPSSPCPNRNVHTKQTTKQGDSISDPVLQQPSH